MLLYKLHRKLLIFFFLSLFRIVKKILQINRFAVNDEDFQSNTGWYPIFMKFLLFTICTLVLVWTSYIYRQTHRVRRQYFTAPGQTFDILVWWSIHLVKVISNNEILRSSPIWRSSTNSSITRWLIKYNDLLCCRLWPCSGGFQILYCTLQAGLYCTVLYRTVMYCTLLHYTVLSVPNCVVESPKTTEIYVL